VLELHNRVIRPKLLADFLPAHYLAGMLQQHGEDLKRLVGQANWFGPILTQFTAAKVEFKGCETDTPLGDVDCQCLPLDYLKVYHDASCGVFLTGPDRSERHHRATPLVALLFELVESALEILRAAGECNRFES